MKELVEGIMDGETAYAKIVSNNGKEFYINELELEIGRDTKSQGPKYFCLSETITLSKNHIKIFFSSDKNSWLIQNLSKNKVNSKEI